LHVFDGLSSDRAVNATWSYWAEFFHHDRADLIQVKRHASGEEMKPPRHMVDQPVFVLPILTLHPGHVLADVVEQVHTSMVAHYPRKG